jgi:hypothetical protein
MTPEEINEIEDNAIMKWGSHAGKSIKDVPASYLLWFNEQPWSNNYEGTKRYIAKRSTQLLIRYRQETGKTFRPRTIVPPLVVEQPVDSITAGFTYSAPNTPIFRINPEARTARLSREEINNILTRFGEDSLDINVENIKKERIIIIPNKTGKNVMIEDERIIDL